MQICQRVYLQEALKNSMLEVPKLPAQVRQQASRLRPLVPRTSVGVGHLGMSEIGYRSISMDKQSPVRFKARLMGNWAYVLSMTMVERGHARRLS